MLDFSHIDYDHYGDKNAVRFWEVFKRGAANMSGIMTVQALTEGLVSQFNKSKKLFVGTLKEIKKEPDPEKWNYGEIDNSIKRKLDEKFVTEKTKKQREEHTQNIVEQVTGKSPAKDNRKANASTTDPGGEKKE